MAWGAGGQLGPKWTDGSGSKAAVDLQKGRWMPRLKAGRAEDEMGKGADRHRPG